MSTLSDPDAPEGRFGWDVSNADTGGYDRCAPLSWIVLPIHGPTASSPYQIMLFHSGRYVGTTTKDPRGFRPSVKRLSPNQIQVTYTYSKPGESTADSSGRAVATFTWDEAQGKVVQTGEVPTPEG